MATTTVRKKVGIAARIALAVMLAVMLSFSVAALPKQAYAANSYTLTIGNANANEGYAAYKLFEGTFSTSTTAEGATTTQFSATNVVTENQDEIEAAFTALGITVPDTSDVTEATKANRLLEAITGYCSTTANTRNFADALAAQILASGATSSPVTTTSGSMTLEEGYYLVVSTDDGYDSTSKTSAMLVAMSGDQTANIKTSTPTLTKKIQDSDGTTGRWDASYGDVADAGIEGEGNSAAVKTATYQLTGTLPSNLADYETYIYNFVDVLPEGVSIATSELEGTYTVTAKYSDGSTADITAAFEASSDSNEGICTVRWECDDLTEVTNFASLTSILLEYTQTYDAADIAVLYRELADINSPQINTAYLEFSNNPYGEGIGTTPKDQTKLYSYNLVVNKVDEDGNALVGAVFTLTNSSGAIVGNNITVGDTGTFTFTGLDAGEQYTLTETTTPTGKKTIEPIKFTITANAIDANGDGILDTVENISASEDADVTDAATVSATGNTVNIKVENEPGPDIPLTGQQGMLLGLAVGGLIVIVSVVALVRNRKQDSE